MKEETQQAINNETKRELELRSQILLSDLKRLNDKLEAELKEKKQPKFLKYIKNELKSIFKGDDKK